MLLSQSMPVPKKSLGVSLRNIYETLAISSSTLVDASLGRLTKQKSDERLSDWAARLIQNGKISLSVTGRENALPGTPYLVMSNHQSLYDVPVLFHALGSNLRMIAKMELFSVPIWGPALRASGFIAIDRHDRRQAVQSLAAAKEKLTTGTPIWIAPEGTRSKDGALLPFKKGGFVLALETGLPILPVTLKGTRDALRAKSFRVTPGASVHVTIHPPIDVAPFAAMGKRPGRETLISEVRRVIESAL